MSMHYEGSWETIFQMNLELVILYTFYKNLITKLQLLEELLKFKYQKLLMNLIRNWIQIKKEFTREIFQNSNQEGHNQIKLNHRQELWSILDMRVLTLCSTLWWESRSRLILCQKFHFMNFKKMITKLKLFIKLLIGEPTLKKKKTDLRLAYFMIMLLLYFSKFEKFMEFQRKTTLNH